MMIFVLLTRQNRKTIGGFLKGSGNPLRRRIASLRLVLPDAIQDSSHSLTANAVFRAIRPPTVRNQEESPGPRVTNSVEYTARQIGSVEEEKRYGYLGVMRIGGEHGEE